MATPVVQLLDGSYTTATYYQNGTAADPNAIWTNDANAFNGDTTTFASNTSAVAGSSASNYLGSIGTSAPASGNRIIQVRVRQYAVVPSGASIGTVILANSSTENVGYVASTNTSAGFSSWSLLNAPSTGWTWAILQGLESRSYDVNTTAGTKSLYRIEYEITTQTSVSTIYNGSSKLDFVGTDADGDTLDYMLEVATDETFNAGFTSLFTSSTISSGYAVRNSGNSKIGQSFGATATSRTLTKIRFNFSKTGTPTGQVRAAIYAHSGTFGTSSVPTGSALATSINTVNLADIGQLGASRTWYDFYFTGFTTTANTNYVAVAELTGTLVDDASNFLVIYGSNTSVTTGNYAAYNQSTTTWGATSTIDIGVQIMYGANTLLVRSDTDTGFADTTDPVHTRPFPPGENIAYTPQATITPGTYYYRVAAKDANTGYGLWSPNYQITLATKPTGTVTNTSDAYRTYTSVGPLSGLTDTFDDNVVDNTKWVTTSVTGNGPYDESGGLANIWGNYNGDTNGMVTKARRSLIGSSISWRYTNPYFEVNTTGSAHTVGLSNTVTIGSWPGAFSISRYGGGGNDLKVIVNNVAVSSTAYNAATMVYFRLRESGGTMYAEYAANPSGTWTSLYSGTTTSQVSTVAFAARADSDYDPVLFGDSSFSIDDLNLTSDLMTGVVSYWKLDDATGSSVLDSKGVNNGTWQGTLGSQWGTGKINGGGIFNGTDNYISAGVTNVPSGGSARSISAWIKYSSIGGSVVAINTASGQKFILNMASVTGTWYIFTDGINSANNLTVSGSNLPTSGTWAHIVFTLDGYNHWKYYLNGTLMLSGTFPTAINTSTPTSVWIGDREDVTGANFTGSIDEVGIWNKTLNGGEVGQLYNGGSGFSYAFGTAITDTRTHSTSSNKRKATTVSHSTDSYVRKMKKVVHIGSQSLDVFTNTQSDTNAVISALTTAIPSLTHIAVAPYLDYGSGSANDQFTKWATSIHNAGKKMWVRSPGFNDWDGRNGTSQYSSTRTNLLMNSGFETNDLYIGIGGNSTKATDSTTSYLGSSSLRMTGSAVDDRLYYTLADGGALTIGQQYTFSAYLKGSGTIRLWIYNGSVDSYSSNITLTNTWTRYSITFTAQATSGLYGGFRQNAAGALTANIDAVLMETGSTLGDFFNGDNFGSWTGTAGNSTSTQNFHEWHRSKMSKWLESNYAIFQAGDVFQPVPDEPENNTLWNSTYTTIGSGAGQTAYNSFITTAINDANTKLRALGVLGVDTAYVGMNPSAAKDVITQNTANVLSALSTDDYPESGLTTPSSMASAMQSEMTTWITPNKPTNYKHITMGPNVYNQLTQQDQADTIGMEMAIIQNTIGRKLDGITVWQFGATDNNPKSRLFDWTGSAWVARSATKRVQSVFEQDFTTNTGFTRDHGTDSYKMRRGTPSHTTDSYLTVSGSLDTDQWIATFAPIVGTFVVHSTDAFKYKRFTASHGTSSVKRKQYTVSHTTSSNKRKTGLVVAHSTDSNKKKSYTLSHTTSANKRVAGILRTHLTDALKRLRPPILHYTDASKKIVGVRSHTTDSLKRKVFTLSHSTDSLKRKTALVSHTADSLKRAQTTKSHTTDALKRGQYSLSHSTSSIKRKAYSVSHFTDSLKRKTYSLSHTTSANKRVSGNLRTHFTDALKRGQYVVSHLTDANKKKSYTVFHQTSANKRKTTLVSHTTDANKRKVYLVSHTTDSLKRQQLLRTHFTDALKRRVYSVFHTTSANKRKETTVSHTTSANKRKVYLASHTTDSFKKNQFTLSHTTSSWKSLPPTSTATYYFNASDSGPTDGTGAWTNDANAFDGNTATSASSSTPAAALTAGGTNAPTSGGTITQVRYRSYGYGSALFGFFSEVYSGGVYIGGINNSNNNVANWSGYVTLSVPSGGWTWQKVNDLVVAGYFDEKNAGSGGSVLWNRSEVEVTYSNALTTTVSHTTDSLKRRAYSASHTTDSNKKKSYSVSHSTSSNKRVAGITHTHLTDALKRRAYSVSQLTDSLKRKIATLSHFTDSLKRKTYTVSHSTDANKKKSYTLVHSTDSNKKKITLLSHFTSANKRRAYSVSHTTSSNKRVAGITVAHTTDSLLRTRTALSHTTNSLKRTLNVLTHFTSSVIRKSNVLTHSTSSNKRKVTLLSHTTDANKRRAYILTHSTDANKKRATVVSHSTDANKRRVTPTSHLTDALKRTRNTLSHTTSALKRSISTLSHSTDSLLRRARTLSHATDANKRKTIFVSHTTDSNKRKAYQLSHSTSANKRKAYLVFHSTDSNKRKAGNLLTHTTDTLLRRIVSIAHSTSALKRTLNVLSHTTNSLKRKTNQLVHTTSANKRKLTTIFHLADSFKRGKNMVTQNTDANKRKAYLVSHTTSASKYKRLTINHTTDSLRRRIVSLTHTTSSNKRKVTLVSHLTDALKRKQFTLFHSTDSNKRRSGTVTHFTDSNKRKANVVQHATDALKRIERVISHATDSFLRLRRIVSHSTDSSIRKQTIVNLTHSTDSFRRGANGLAHTTDVNKRKVTFASHLTDTLKRRVRSVVHLTSSVKRRSQPVSHYTSSILRGANQVYHTTGSFLHESHIVQHSTDSFLRKVRVVIHTTSSNKKRGNSVSHSTDAVFAAPVGVGHTTDALLLSHRGEKLVIVNGVWKYGKVYVLVNGQWVATELMVYIDNEWGHTRQ